jgi:hypothetical protein
MVVDKYNNSNIYSHCIIYTYVHSIILSLHICLYIIFLTFAFILFCTATVNIIICILLISTQPNSSKQHCQLSTKVAESFGYRITQISNRSSNVV